MPQMQFSTEVLPAPFGPMSARSSPARASSETRSSTFRPPNASDTALTSSSAIPPPAAPVLLDVPVAAPRRAAAGAEVELTHVGMLAQPLRHAVQDDAAVLHDVAVVGQVEGHLGVLLDQEKRHAEAFTD